MGALFGIAVQVRVAAAHLRFQRRNHVSGVESATLLGQHDLECDVEQQVADLAAQPVVGCSFDDVLGQFQRLFQQVGRQRDRCLGGVPGAAGAEEADQVEGPVEDPGCRRGVSLWKFPIIRHFLHP